MTRSRYTIFFLILGLVASGILLAAADFGESSASLGQITDEFTSLDNVSVRVLIERNATLNAMELNSSDGGNGFDGFSFYIEFNIDFNRIGSNLSSFPVLLNISDNTGISNDDITTIFDRIGDSYQKLAITNTSMLTEYFIEVESWDATSELAYLWFSPDVSSLENGTFRIHFDSSHANNTARVGLPGSVVAANVWDSSFQIVHHLSGDNQTDTEDSTSNNMDVTGSFGDPTYDVAGQINGAVDFDGNDDLSIADNVILEPSQMTLEVWIKTTSTQQFAGFIDRRTGNTEGYDIDYPAADGKPRFIIEFGGGLFQEIKSSIAINDGAYHYVVGRYDEVNLKIYVDGVERGTIAENDNIVYGNHAFFMPGDQVSTHRADTELDEVRLSEIPRSADWINATYLTGIDDLIYWRSEVEAVAFALSGYFTTTDYLSGINGSVLVQLTNATIPGGTGITAEFSEDNSTWVNPTALTAGFQSIDLRDLNWSAAHYVRYNMTGTGSDTPRLYQSRLITTIGAIGAGAPGQNVSGEWVTYNLTEIGVTVGILDAGDLNSTLDIDGDLFNVSEVVGAPGMQISGNFSGIDPDSDCLWLVIYAHYDGNLNHEFDIEVWDFTSSAWVEDGPISDGVALEWFNSTIYELRIPNDFLSGGEVRVRLDHESPGNINHDLFIEYFKLVAKIPAGPTPGAGAVIIVETDPAPWIAIAIILMCVAYLLLRPK